MLGELLYETDVIAYDTASKNYVNPKTSSIYGTAPPPGGWAVTWYQDPANNIPITVVSGTQTVSQIASQLATSNTPAIPQPFSLSSLTTMQWVMIGGAAVAGYLLMKGGR